MARDSCILAFDHGTSGIKAALVTSKGRIIDACWEKTPIMFLPDGGVEQDPATWIRGMERASLRLLENKPEYRRNIAAIAVTSTFSTTVAVGKDKEPVANAMTWMDARGAPHVKKLVSGFPSVQGYSLAMVAKWLPKTGGGPTLSGKDDIAHLLYWKNEKPEVYEKTRWFLPSKDYINLYLTGEAVATFDSVQLFWVTDIRDPRNIRYVPELIEKSGIDAEKLPPLCAPTEIAGRLRKKAAKRLGVSPGIPVIAGSPDHQTACVGSGAVYDFGAHLYIGTSSWVQAVVPFKKTDVFHSIASFPTAIPGRYQTANEQDMAGGCIENFFSKIIFHKDPIGGIPPENPYEKIDEAAAMSPPGSGGVIFFPWLNGERTPVEENHLRGVFFNMNTQTNRCDLLRSVLEGVALNTRWSFHYVEKFVKTRLDPLHFVGGGAKSGLWCRILSDVLGREILQIENPRQANARGAAWIAAVGIGEISFSDIPDLVSVKKRYKPDPGNRSLYDELFSIFLQFHKKNKGLFMKINQ